MYFLIFLNILHSISFGVDENGRSFPTFNEARSTRSFCPFMQILVSSILCGVYKIIQI